MEVKKGIPHTNVNLLPPLSIVSRGGSGNAEMVLAFMLKAL
jgi:hypothetical protein